MTVAQRLRAVAASAAHACTRWRQAAAAWNELVTETQGLTAPNVCDTADVVVRLGRLVFANPGSTPAVPGRIPVRDVAPGGAHCATVIGALHHAVDALALISTAGLRAVTTAARERVYVLTRSLPDGYDVPYRFAPITPAGARHLAGAYQAACHATSNLLMRASAIDTAARSLIAQAERASQRREGPRRKDEGRRATAPRGKDQARVAAASFPSGPAIPGRATERTSPGAVRHRRPDRLPHPTSSPDATSAIGFIMVTGAPA